MDAARLLVGFVARLIMWAAFALIVVDAVVMLWRRGDEALAVVSVVLFPLTVFIWPWKHTAHGYPLWIAAVVGLIAYPVSTFIGGLPPAERPGDF